MPAGVVMDVAILFSGLNAVLLVALLFIYAKIALRSRASHSVGLMFFAILLLANSLLTVYSYVAMAPFFGKEALPYLSMMSVLEFVGLAVLLKITL
jgi:hypothetical protein